MTESKYLLIPAEGDLDEDEGMTMLELFAAHLPHQMKAAARYRMMERLVAEQDAGEEGPLLVAAEAITEQLDNEYRGDVPLSKGLPRLLDELIKRFPETA